MGIMLMNRQKNASDNHEQNSALNRLAADLTEFNRDFELSMDDDMLSLIVDEAHQGVDISRRYPNFYRKMLSNANLRQAFLDILESLEMENAADRIELPGKVGINLDFLAKRLPAPVIEKANQNNWRISWQQTFEKLKEIFSPQELAYRGENDTLDDPWFVLLRDEIELEETLYSVALNCTLSEKGDDALAAYLNIAITLSTTSPQPSFPLTAQLQWGNYNERISLSDEGCIRFPDIPFENAFDEEFNLIESELNFALESTT